MRIWNVSKSTPIENLRLKKTGFHAMTVFTTAPGSTALDRQNFSSGDSTNQSSSSPSQALPPSLVPHGGRYALPNAHAVCTFLDGGVGLYDLGKRKWDFLRELVSHFLVGIKL